MAFGIQGDTNVRSNLAGVEHLLRHVCDDEELPWYVSDEATIFDVSTASEETLRERVAAALGRAVTHEDLKLPLWQLAKDGAASPR